MVGRQQSAGMASTREPGTLAPYGSSLFAPSQKQMEHATEFWAPSPAGSCQALPLAANFGEHTQARNHHSTTQRDPFSRAATMHARINPEKNILASQPHAERKVHAAAATVLN